MKSISVQLGIAALALGLPFAAHADTDKIVSGTQTLTFTPAILQQITSRGGTITDFNGTPLTATNGVVLNVVGGVVDLQSGLAEAITSGGIKVNVVGLTISFQDLTFDATGPNTSTVSGIFSVDGHVIGREAVFVYDSFPSFGALPLQSTDGQISYSGAGFKLSPAFVTLLNTIYQQPILSASVEAGTNASTDAVTLQDPSIGLPGYP